MRLEGDTNHVLLFFKNSPITALQGKAARRHGLGPLRRLFAGLEPSKSRGNIHEDLRGRVKERGRPKTPIEAGLPRSRGGGPKKRRPVSRKRGEAID